MTDTNPDQTLRDTAIGWLVHVQSDAATGGDWNALADWLEQSPAHLAAFEDVERLSLELTDRAREIAASLPSPRVTQPTAAKIRQARLGWPPAAGVFAVAASLAAAALIGGPALWRSYDGMVQTYQTGAGETRVMRLDDGSQIHLNATTTLIVQQGWRSRRATLGNGEASFDVAKDSSRPFLIAVGDERVRVVGTEFNIRHYDPAVEITVRRGVVEVWPAALGRASAVRLIKGQSVRQAAGAAPAAPQATDPDTVFAWTQGRLIYDRRPLAEVVIDLNRRFKTPIRLLPAAASRTFSGVLILDDEDTVVRRLAAYMRLSVDRKPGEFVLG
jgi:transmembrane sensor